MPQLLLLASPASAVQPYFLALENNLVGSTFFFGMFALLGGALFLFLERDNVPRRWHVNVTLAGIICLVAGISYYYMQGQYDDKVRERFRHHCLMMMYCSMR